MPASRNQQIADALVKRHLLASRVEAGWREDLMTALAVLDMDIIRALKAADPTEFAMLTRRRRAVTDLLDETLAPLIMAWYVRTAARFDTLLGRLATNEAGAVQDIVNDVTEDEVIAEIPPDTSLRRRVAAALIPSASRPTDLSTTGADWWARQGESLLQRLGDQLMVSVSLEESLTQMTQRVRGTSDAGFQDGVMGRARQDASRLLTTQVTNAVSEARVAVAERNTGRLVLQHRALLEEKNVCIICFTRHGKRYTAEAPHEPIGHALPYLLGVPYHPLCRCSMDTVLASGGGVITDETLSAWLRRQGTAFQNELLGPTRAQMFRDGKLTPKNLLDASTGRPLTLEEVGA